MARSIQDFVANFDGGARANLYKITVTPPPGASLTNQFANVGIFARSAQLPGSVLGEILVPYLGRVAKLPGDRTYEDFTVGIMNTEDMQLRRAFELWNASMNLHRENVSSTPLQKSLWYQGTVVVEQLSRSGTVKRTYTLQHAFPKEVSAVEVAYDNNDSISEFTVTFAYTYFTLGAVGGAAPGNP